MNGRTLQGNTGAATLYMYTDNVLPPETHAESLPVESLPEYLRNMLVISIRPARLERFMERIGRFSSNVTVIDGVNGEFIDMKELESTGVIRAGCSLTKGEIGCFLSHRLAWERIVQGTEEHGFIMEDDCQFRPSVKNLQLIETALAEAKEIPWDIFYIARNPAHCKNKERISQHVVRVGHTWGLMGYIVTKKAARELLQETTTIRYAADTFVSLTRKAAPVKLAVSPIPFVVVPEISDTVNIK